MDDDARFGEVRGLLESAPKPRPTDYKKFAAWDQGRRAWWRELLACLDAWGSHDALREEVVPYVLERLPNPTVCPRILPKGRYVDGKYQPLDAPYASMRQRFLEGEPVGWAPLLETLEVEVVDREDPEILSYYEDRTSDVVAALPRGARPSRLELAMMSHTYLPVAARLLADPGLTEVRSLELKKWAARSSLCIPQGALEAMQALASNPALAGLQRIWAADNDLGDEAIMALCDSPHLRTLFYLNLGGHEGESGNQVTDAGVQALATSEVLRSVGELDLSWNRGIGPRGHQALLESPHTSHLYSLDLSITSIGDEGVRLLAQWEHADGMDELSVIISGVSDEAWALLENAPGWQGCDISR